MNLDASVKFGETYEVAKPFARLDVPQGGAAKVSISKGEQITIQLEVIYKAPELASNLNSESVSIRCDFSEIGFAWLDPART
jgi:hypothetical protein